MKNYFAYPIDDEIRKRLSNFYESPELSQHSARQMKKAALKVRRIKEIVQFGPQDEVLDIGCSKGYVLQAVIHEIKTGVGIDISKNIIDANTSGNTNKKLQFIHVEGEDFTLNRKFDKVLMLDVLEHSFHPDQLVQSAKHALKENGSLVIQVPFTGWLAEKVFGEYHEGHLRYYDPDYLQKYLQRFALQTVALRTYNSVPYASSLLQIQPLWKTLDLLVHLLPPRYFPYYGEILIVVRKNAGKDQG